MATFDLATMALTPSSGSIELAVPVPDGALGLDLSKPGLMLVRPDGTFVSLVAAEASRLATWVTTDFADNSIVWVESDDGPMGYVNATIWTSVYTPDAAGIRRRAIARFDDTRMRGGAGMVVNRGVALTAVSDDTGLLTRLSDGRGWKIVAEPGLSSMGPLWVDDDEVVFTVGDSKYPFGTMTGILRIRRDSLGEPTVAPGL